MLLTHSPKLRGLPRRCYRSIEEVPPKVSAATGPGRLSATHPGNGGSGQQTEYVIDQCAWPDSRRSSDLRAACAGEREPGQWWGLVRLRASRSGREAAS